MSLHIPPAVLIGDNITLTCSYDLEGEPLYMVKWYKGQDEFFRITPKELPHMQVFPLAGIHVNVSSWWKVQRMEGKTPVEIHIS